jgi:hypothetical protein
VDGDGRDAVSERESPAYSYHHTRKKGWMTADNPQGDVASLLQLSFVATRTVVRAAWKVWVVVSSGPSRFML